MRYLIILLSVIMFGCQDDFSNREFTDIPIFVDGKNDNGEAREIVRSFYYDAQTYGADINWMHVKIKYMGEIHHKGIKAAGLCRKSKHQPHKNEILIDTTSIKYKQSFKRLLYHELAHYYLSSSHSEEHMVEIVGGIPSVIPLSIMNTILIPSHLMDYLWDTYYVPELFGHANEDDLVRLLSEY